MSSAPPAPVRPEDLARDARWLLQAYDGATHQARLVEMDREAYRAASFLDDRMFSRPLNAHILPWPVVESGLSQAKRRDARWIFHIGHVGSTLVARLLGEIPGVLAIREPRFLRDIAAGGTQMADVAQRAFSRTFDETETALVKVTSSVSEIAPALVPAGERALFMYAGPRAYVATILAGESSLQELRFLAEIRAARSKHRVTGLERQSASDAHLAAAAWACEMTSLEAAAEAMDNCLVDWADFDSMLDDMARALGRVTGFFGFAASPDQVRAAAEGPLMARYSKALEYEYSANLRRDLIAQASAHHRADIDDALAMLLSAAEKSPLLARALTRAGEN
jgi:hypothetical protein